MEKRHSKNKNKWFSSLLLQWNKLDNHRGMPWKGEKDPYKIWLSEIILQQTRVEQGLKYYQRFLESFPTVHMLAKAPDEKVFKHWEGLGYYSRCRNLLFTARYISSKLKGQFPENYEKIRALKGIGPYTAAAISSFAFNQPYAVVDGNVFRVLSRVFGIGIPIDSTAGKKYFTELASALLDQDNPGLYNQAIMDFGATICKPATPVCSECIFQKKCVAFKDKKVNELPVKEKKLNIKKRVFCFFVLEYKNTIAIRKRNVNDIWKDLFEFPLMEMEKELKPAAIIKIGKKNKWLPETGYALQSFSPRFQQQLSHQLISGIFMRINLAEKPRLQNDWLWVSKNKLAKYPFPQLIHQYLGS